MHAQMLEPQPPPPLHPYQSKAVDRILREPNHRGILNFATGLGKTATAIELLKRIYRPGQSVFIVCPAIAQHTWAGEFLKFWPECKASVGIIRHGINTKALGKRAEQEREQSYTADIKIISYALLENITGLQPHILIIDELHRVKTPTSIQSKLIRKLSRRIPSDGAVIGLTGTLIPDIALDLWNQIDTIYPGRWGTLWKSRLPDWRWQSKYLVLESNGWGTRAKGVREERAEELQCELDKLAIRVTREEAAPWLPTFLIEKLEVESQDRYGAIESWLAERIDGYQHHLCVATHERIAAEEIAARAKRAHPEFHVELIHGALSVEERHRTLLTLRAQKKAILVCTYHSLLESLSLTEYEAVLIAQLYWSPKTMLQFFGRFSRLTSTVPSKVELLVLEGTSDERIASFLLRKTSEMNSLLRPGSGEAALEATLGLSEQDFIDAWQHVREKTTDAIDSWEEEE